MAYESSTYEGDATSLIEALASCVPEASYKAPALAEALLVCEDGRVRSFDELLDDSLARPVAPLLCDALRALLEDAALLARELLKVADGAGLEMTPEELRGLLQDGAQELGPLVRLAILLARSLGDDEKGGRLSRLTSLERSLERLPQSVPDVLALFEVSELGDELEGLLRTRFPERGKAPEKRWPSADGPFVCLGVGGGEALLRVLSGEREGKPDERRAQLARDFSVRMNRAAERANEMLASGEVDELPDGDLLGLEEAETLAKAGVWPFVAWEQAMRDLPRSLLVLERLWGLVFPTSPSQPMLGSTMTELHASTRDQGSLSVSLEPFFSSEQEDVVYLPPRDGDRFVQVYSLNNLRAAVADLVGSVRDGLADEDFAREQWERMVATPHLPMVRGGVFSMTEREFSLLGLCDGASVVVIGNGDHVEVWPVDAWEQEEAGLEDELGELIQRSFE